MRVNFDTFADCVGRIAERGGTTAEQARDILQEVANRGEALRNATIRKGLMDKVEANGGLGTAADTLRAVMYGSNKGERDNVQSTWRGLAAGWQGLLSWKLHSAGVEKAAISGELDGALAEALWRAHGGTPDPRVKVSSAAQAMADAVKPLQDIARERLNAAGARIGDALDYVAHTDHDPRTMRAAAGPRRTADDAFTGWWRAEQPRWGKRTYENLVPRRGETMQDASARFGRSVFDALVTGIHMTADGVSGIATGAGFVPPAFEGTRNLAAKSSQPRVISYKDAASWLAHQQQYLKGILDYMLFYHLYEAASPGWWERTNRRLVKEQGRAMKGYTPGGGGPTGVPWLYMQNQRGQSFGLTGSN